MAQAQAQPISLPKRQSTRHIAESPTTRIVRRFLRNPLAVFGLVVLAMLALSALLANQIAPFDPNAVDPYNALLPPSGKNWLGTDDLGRDVFSRLIYAGRVSLLVGVGTALVASVIGTLLGALAGFYSGWIDGAISRLIDIMLSLPVVPVALVVGAFTRVTPWSITIVLAALSWMTVARLVRSDFLELRGTQFVDAARNVGASGTRIIFRHLLPNTVSNIVVATTLLLAFAILIESALSFLGFGVQPPTATWGNMLYNAQRYIRTAPWLAISAGVVISLTVASANFVGDGIREAIDPRLKQ